MVVQAQPQSLSVNGHLKRPFVPGIQKKMPPDEASPEPFQAIGFRFVRWFLLIILLVVGGLMGLVGFLGWHLGMDVTVEGYGQIEPTARYDAKTHRSGLIKRVHVQQGQAVKRGDLMVTLEDTDLRSELEQNAGELLMNQSRRVALAAELQRERAVLEADLMRADVALETAKLQLEHVQKEYHIYHKYMPYRLDGSVRPSVDSLMPIRLQKTRVRQAEVDVERAKRRLVALNSRKQEQKTLMQMYEKLTVNRRLIQTHLEQMKVCAPVDGTVLTRDLDKRVGDRLMAGEAVIELAELNGWRVKAMVQEVDIPKVKVGQVVRLYVNAFPHMEYKVFEGQVTDVPRKPETGSSAVAGLVPGNVMGTVYPVKIRVIDPHVSDGETEYSLAYGMGVRAKIVTERGPIIDLIWKKFLKTVGKIGRPEIYRLETPVENVQTMN